MDQRILPGRFGKRCRMLVKWRMKKEKGRERKGGKDRRESRGKEREKGTDPLVWMNPWARNGEEGRIPWSKENTEEAAA